MAKAILKWFLATVVIFTFANYSWAQSTKNSAMEKLNFLVGEWVGISRTYQGDGILTEVPAYEKIQYKLDKSIITIDLSSETLQLHTVIYYDEKTQKYFYNPFYVNGAAKYEADLKDGEFVVNPTSSKRFVFRLTEDGKFQEYGENLIDGKWVKYFEDTFTKMK